MIGRRNEMDRPLIEGSSRRIPSCRWAAALLAAGLGACASFSDEPSPEVKRANWEAQNVYPQGYRSEILAYMRTYLNEPGNVRDAFISEPELKPMGLGNRYVSCVRYGPKRPSADNAASKDHIAVFVGGKLDAFRDAKDGCSSVAYAPFPELERLTR
jgi:hypothetical protein